MERKDREHYCKQAIQNKVIKGSWSDRILRIMREEAGKIAESKEHLIRSDALLLSRRH